MSMTKEDLKQTLLDARDLAQQGAYADALGKYSWIYENAIEIDSSWYGVRNSYILGEWANLGNHYPAARVELESIRDAKTNLLKDGLLERNLFIDVASINEALKQEDDTCALFAQIAEKDRAFAQTCFSPARIALVHARQYSLARSFIKYPQETLTSLTNRLQQDLESNFIKNADYSIQMHKTLIDIYIEDVQQLLEILVGVGEKDEAERIAIIAVDSIPPSVCRDEIHEKLNFYLKKVRIDGNSE